MCVAPVTLAIAILLAIGPLRSTNALGIWHEGISRVTHTRISSTISGTFVALSHG